MTRICADDRAYTHVTDKLRDAAVFVDAAQAVAEDHGPVLWGREEREHLYAPSEVRDTRGCIGIGVRIRMCKLSVHSVSQW